MDKVCIVGLGYVGLTLAVTLAEAGVEVLGVDTNQKVIDQLNQHKVYFYEKGLQEALPNKNLAFSDHIIKGCNYYIICVGTPIDQNKKPNFKYLENAMVSILPYLRFHDTVILRSTVPVGISRKLYTEYGLFPGTYFAFVPERTVEGNALQECKTIPQIVGALDDESFKKVEILFKKFNPNIIRLPDMEHAEMLKLIDNTFRDVTFAYSNQMSLICDKLNLNLHTILKAINKDYRAFVPSPSPGVGGACLTKDPYILMDLCRQLDVTSLMIETARKINEYIPKNIATKIIKHLDGKLSPKILISGFAFKGNPPTSDIRFSPTLDLLKCLEGFGYDIYGWDAIVPAEEIEKLGVKLIKERMDFDVIVVMNNHPLNRQELLNGNGCLLIDPWNLYDTLA